MSAPTIGEKLRGLIQQDDTAGFVTGAESRPKVEQLSDWERDLVNWGAVYGLAYGLVRAEDPFASFADTAARAFDAAWPVFLEWAGDFEYEQRDRRQVVENVVREFAKTCNDRSRLPRGFEDLEDALIDLSNNTGL